MSPAERNTVTMCLTDGGDGSIALVMLNRPHRANSIDAAKRRELTEI
jgi:enoyl-CoA hydratase/carnithine racemase